MAHEEIVFRRATPGDESALKALLAEAGLPSQDVGHAEQEFIVALDDGVLIGSVGLERYGGAALLRSLAVKGGLRGRRLGSELYDRIVEHARRGGVTVTYLLTTTAEQFFRARGFERIDRAAVPDALRATAEFKSLCPATAVCMRLRLEDGASPTRRSTPCGRRGRGGPCTTCSTQRSSRT
jgi:amino-acid N-acetyltransferase